MRRTILLAGVAVLVLALAPPASAEPPLGGPARGPNSPFLVTTNDVDASQSSGEPIQVRAGTWVRFRMGWSDADTYLPYVQSILTMEILLDGQPLPTETYTEDMGVLCDAYSGTLICLESDVFWAFALTQPLRPNVLHTVTLRWSFSGALDDPFGYSFDAGDVQETTGTLLVVPHPA